MFQKALEYLNIKSTRKLYQHNNGVDMKSQYDVYIYAMGGNVDKLITALNQSDNCTNWYREKSSGCTALHRSAEAGQIECVEILLDKGIDVNSCNYYGWTALYYTSGNGFKNCINLLLSRGADVNMKIDDGSTALFRAARNGSIECIQLLLNYGADINICTVLGKSALHEAARWGNIECIKILIDHGIEIEENIDNYKPHSNYYTDCRLIILAELEDRRKRYTFDSFISHYIEYQPYINNIYTLCYHTGNLQVSKPSVGWMRAEAIRDKYYLDEVFFYLHMHIANIYTNKKSGVIVTTNLVSMSTEQLINNNNDTFLLMTILTDQLKNMLIKTTE
jgi:hypothetical protein